MEIFSRFGRVSHAVILATIDNASRRRGFIVMSTHAEARSAISSLSRTEIKYLLLVTHQLRADRRFRRGHLIDVSWAVVQRSQGQLVATACCLTSTDVSVVGFLDGGDRSTALPPSIMPPPPAERENPPLENASTANPPGGTQSPFVVSIAVTSTLLIRNLPSLLFSQPSEFEPLLLPFGQIKKADVLETFGSGSTGSVTVAVEYATTDSAYEAKMTLDGQIYVNHVLKIEFVQPMPSVCDVLSPQFPPVDGPSALQVPRRRPLVNSAHGYNSRSAGITTPTNGHLAASMGALCPASSSAPATPYPFSAGFGMSSYFASDTPSTDGTLDDAQPPTRPAEI